MEIVSTALRYNWGLQAYYIQKLWESNCSWKSSLFCTAQNDSHGEDRLRESGICLFQSSFCVLGFAALGEICPHLAETLQALISLRVQDWEDSYRPLHGLLILPLCPLYSACMRRGSLFCSTERYRIASQATFMTQFLGRELEICLHKWFGCNLRCGICKKYKCKI